MRATSYLHNSMFDGQVRLGGISCFDDSFGGNELLTFAVV